MLYDITAKQEGLWFISIITTKTNLHMWNKLVLGIYIHMYTGVKRKQGI